MKSMAGIVHSAPAPIRRTNEAKQVLAAVGDLQRLKARRHFERTIAQDPTQQAATRRAARANVATLDRQIYRAQQDLQLYRQALRRRQALGPVRRSRAGGQ